MKWELLRIEINNIGNSGEEIGRGSNRFGYTFNLGIKHFSFFLSFLQYIFQSLAIYVG